MPTDQGSCTLGQSSAKSHLDRYVPITAAIERGRSNFFRKNTVLLSEAHAVIRTSPAEHAFAAAWNSVKNVPSASKIARDAVRGSAPGKRTLRTHSRMELLGKGAAGVKVPVPERDLLRSWHDFKNIANPARAHKTLPKHKASTNGSSASPN